MIIGRKIIPSQKQIGLFVPSIIFYCSLFFSSSLLAISPNEHDQKASNLYQAYFELGGIKYFNKNSNMAGIYDLFIPLYQNNDHLFFTDLRIFDRSGNSFEGNVHFGYRKLYPETEQMFGIYGAFDRKRSDDGNAFNQVTVGFEYWKNKLFIGGNIYRPIGKKEKDTSELKSDTHKDNLTMEAILRTKVNEKTTISYGVEKPIAGIDTEVGYSITERLTGYVGGYYFAADGVDTVTGPKIRLTYDYLKTTGHVFGILDGISIEIGAQHDKPRGNIGYVGIKLKIGLTNERNSNIQGFSRHMVELVRRDHDIVTRKTRKPRMVIISEEVDIVLEDVEKFLHIDEKTTIRDIHKKFKNMFLKTHPDRNPEGLEAYMMLSAFMDKSIKRKTIGAKEQKENPDSSWPKSKQVIRTPASSEQSEPGVVSLGTKQLDLKPVLRNKEREPINNYRFGRGLHRQENYLFPDSNRVIQPTTTNTTDDSIIINMMPLEETRLDNFEVPPINQNDQFFSDLTTTAQPPVTQDAALNNNTLPTVNWDAYNISCQENCFNALYPIKPGPFEIEITDFLEKPLMWSTEVIVKIVVKETLRLPAYPISIVARTTGKYFKSKEGLYFGNKTLSIVDAKDVRTGIYVVLSDKNTQHLLGLNEKGFGNFVSVPAIAKILTAEKDNSLVEALKTAEYYLVAFVCPAFGIGEIMCHMLAESVAHVLEKLGINSQIVLYVDPIIKHVLKPIQQYVINPIQQYAIEPVLKPIQQYVINPTQQYVIEPVFKPIRWYVLKPVYRFANEIPAGLILFCWFLVYI